MLHKPLYFPLFEKFLAQADDLALCCKVVSLCFVQIHAKLAII
uniref:Uncharacterized protein n=1 Tax=Arundo donax TaxID=35708 RepID=A0A0A9GY22_ARUDO